MARVMQSLLSPLAFNVQISAAIYRTNCLSTSHTSTQFKSSIVCSRCSINSWANTTYSYPNWLQRTRSSAESVFILTQVAHFTISRRNVRLSAVFLDISMDFNCVWMNALLLFKLYCSIGQRDSTELDSKLSHKSQNQNGSAKVIQ